MSTCSIAAVYSFLSLGALVASGSRVGKEDELLSSYGKPMQPSVLAEVHAHVRAEYTHAGYKKHFRRTYADGSNEDAFRKKIFDQNVARILKHNARQLPWKEAVNQFTDRTEEEMQQYRGYRKQQAKTQAILSFGSLLESDSAQSSSDVSMIQSREPIMSWQLQQASTRCLVQALLCVSAIACILRMWMSTVVKSESDTYAWRIIDFTVLVVSLTVFGYLWTHPLPSIPTLGPSSVKPLASETASTCRVQGQTCKASFTCCSGLTCNSKGVCAESLSYLPDSFDWSRTLPSGKLVMDQGACGSCWAVAAVGAVQLQAELLGNKSAPAMSAQGMLGCAPNPNECGGQGQCRGSIPELGYAWAAKHGIHDATAQVYTATDDCPKSSSSAAVSILGYMKLEENKVKPILDALVIAGPLTVAVEGGAWHGYGSGVFDGCAKDNIVVDHAVLLMGYGADRGAMYWKIRNSWGAGWGENGFIRLRRFADSSGSGSEPCAWDNDPSKGVACKDPRTHQYPKRLWVCGTCGILSDVSYPLGAELVQFAPQV